MPKALITGAGGLVGSQCAELLGELGWDVVGLDNNLRAQLFGPAGSVAATIERLRGPAKTIAKKRALTARALDDLARWMSGERMAAAE